MRVYIMRHGIAVDRDDAEYPEDADRPLTVEGAQRTRRALQGLADMGVGIDRIATSPLRRSVQTSELASEVFGLTADLAIRPEFAPAAGNAARWLESCRALKVDDVLCIGHSPEVDDWIAHAVGAPQRLTSLKKAGIAVISIDDDPTGRLVALYEPKVLRRIGWTA
ncbi:MAG: phosphohistidine phosphatase SixA [Myxococcota bacterium]